MLRWDENARAGVRAARFPVLAAAGWRLRLHAFFTALVASCGNLHSSDVVDLLAEEGKVSGLKLFHTMNSGVTEVTPRLAAVEADVQDLVKVHVEAMLSVTFLASEYVIDCVDGGRIDSLGPDENGA